MICRLDSSILAEKEPPRPVTDINKVAGRGPKGQGDACKLEFDYTCNRKGVESIVALVMEPRCHNTKAWGGPVGGYLGGRLYLDLTKDDAEAFEVGAHKLVAEVRKLQAAAELRGEGSTNRMPSHGKNPANIKPDTPTRTATARRRIRRSDDF